MPYLTTEEAAKRLGVSDAYVRRLILDKRLRARKVPAPGGGEWLVEERDLYTFTANRRPRGRPRKIA